MAIDGLSEGVPPSGRVPRQLLHAAPILKRRRRRYRGEFAKVRSILGVSTPRAKYRRRGHLGDPPVSQEGPWRGLGLGRASCPPGWLGWPSSALLIIPEASVGLIFYLIFPEFLEHF